MTDAFFIRDKRKGNFFQIDNVIVDHYLSRLGVYAFVVYSVLVKYSKNGSTFVSHKSVAKDIRCSPATVKTAIDVLMGAGLLSVKSGKDTGSTNTYFIMEPPSPGSRPDAPPVPESESTKLVFLPDGKVVEREVASVEGTPSGDGGGSQPESYPPPTSDTRGSSDDSFPILKNKTNKTIKTNKTVADAPEVVLPPWLDVPTWDAYLSMRKQIKRPATPLAQKIVLGRLKNFEAMGYSSRDVLEQSVVNCWQDVYEVKRGGRSNGHSNDVAARTQHNRNAVTAVHERIDRAAAQGDSFGGGSYGGGDGD